jgi:hypothetical protein
MTLEHPKRKLRMVLPPGGTTPSSIGNLRQAVTDSGIGLGRFTKKSAGPCGVIPDFYIKIEYSSHVCPGTIWPHIWIDIVITTCQMSQIEYLLLHEYCLTKD